MSMKYYPGRKLADVGLKKKKTLSAPEQRRQEFKEQIEGLGVKPCYARWSPKFDSPEPT